MIITNHHPHPRSARLIRFFCYLVGAFITCLPAAGCLNFSQFQQPPLEIQFYSLEYEPPSVKIEAVSSAPVLKIKSFTAGPLYDSRLIVYRQKAFQTGEYAYHQWHVRPAAALAQLLARDMRRSAAFQAVFGPESTNQGSYDLEGEVEKFLEDDTEKNWRAVLSLSITLCDATEPDRKKQIVFQKQYKADQPCRRNHPTALAEAMSAAMKNISAQIIVDVYGAIQNRGNHHAES